MSENILEPTATSGSDLVGGDSSTGDPSEVRVGTPKVGGVSPSVAPTHKKFPLLASILLILLSLVAAIAIYLFLQVRTLTLEKVSSSPSPTPIASADPTANWQRYEGKLFSFAFPPWMTLNERVIEDPDNVNNEGVMVEVKSETEEIQVSSDFAGGWGGSPCVVQSDRTIAEYPTQISIWKKEAVNNQECMDVYVDFVALVNHSNFEHPFPILIELRGLAGKTYADSTLFDQILSTFKFTETTKNIPGKCTYNGKTYQEGESLKIDKCNTCSCSNGEVICTLMACE